MATPLTSRIGVDTCDFWALPCCDSAGDLNGGGMGVRGFCVRSRLAGGLGRLEAGSAASPSSSDLRRFSTPLVRSTVLSFDPDVCLAKPSERSFLTSAVFLELSRSCRCRSRSLSELLGLSFSTAFSLRVSSRPSRLVTLPGSAFFGRGFIFTIRRKSVRRLLGIFSLISFVSLTAFGGAFAGVTGSLRALLSDF